MNAFLLSPACPAASVVLLIASGVAGIAPQICHKVAAGCTAVPSAQGQIFDNFFAHFEGSGQPRAVDLTGPKPPVQPHMSPGCEERDGMTFGRRNGRG